MKTFTFRLLLFDCDAIVESNTFHAFLSICKKTIAHIVCEKLTYAVFLPTLQF